MTNPRVIPLAQRTEAAADDGEGFPVAELKADQFGALFMTLSDPVQGTPLLTGSAAFNMPVAEPDIYLQTLSGMYAWDELGSGDLVKLRAFAAAEDVSSPQIDDGWLATNAALMLYNASASALLGMISADTTVASVNESNANWLRTAGAVYLHEGSSFARAGAASASRLAAQSGNQAALATAPGEWTLTHLPVANTVATATRAAGAAGVRHVLRSINATLVGVAAIASPISVVVRDGATGVGPILWADQLFAAAAGSKDRVTLTGLNIIGSAATAMTVEFTAAPGATNFEALAATGYSSAAQAA